jgi:hypothetical protein
VSFEFALKDSRKENTSEFCSMLLLDLEPSLQTGKQKDVIFQQPGVLTVSSIGSPSIPK